MSWIVRVVLGLLIGGSLIFTASGSSANTTVNVNIGPPPPIVVAAPPPLVVVPVVPVVSYVPSVQADVFVYQNQWYYAHDGHWWVGRPELPRMLGSRGPGQTPAADRCGAGSLLQGATRASEEVRG